MFLVELFSVSMINSFPEAYCGFRAMVILSNTGLPIPIDGVVSVKPLTSNKPMLAMTYHAPNWPWSSS
jgi:hypothetical protein